MIGSGASLSRYINAARKAAPIASGTRTSLLPQPAAASACPSPMRIGVVDARIRAAPSQSIIGLRRGLGSRRRLRQHNKSASNPNGKLIQKIQCQVRYSEKKPPSTGPSTFEIAIVLEKYP